MPTLQIGAAWQRARPGADPASAAPWSPLDPRDRQTGAGWQPGRAGDVDSRGVWDAVAARDARRQARWQRATTASARPAAAGWDNVPARDLSSAQPWDRSLQPRDSLRLRLLYNPRPARRDPGHAEGFRRVDLYGPRLDAEAERQRSLYRPGPLLVFAFAGARYAPGSAPQVYFDFRYTPPARRAIQPVDSARAASGWQSARRLDLRRRLPWGQGRAHDPDTGIAYPDDPGPVYVIEPPAEPDILESYMIANSVSLVVLPERIPVEATAIRVGRDIDAFAWTLTCELFGRTALNLLRPDAHGPKTVELTINGWSWRFLIERYSSSRSFPAERYSLTGVSRSQLLAAPYAPPRSAVNAVPINAAQAAADQLEHTGFTLSWDYSGLGPPDWTLPAGAFSYQQQSALQVIARIAEAVGGVVKPARDSDALAVVPRYREAPWQWGQAIMDRIVPIEVVSDMAGEWSPQPRWDSVYVSGSSHGVAVDVRRRGSAGSHPAPDVFDDLITGTDAARARGIAELARSGDQEIVTLSLPLFPVGGMAPGLIEPAHLCEVREADGHWRGLCLETAIAAEGVGASRVTQSIKLERHH